MTRFLESWAKALKFGWAMSRRLKGHRRQARGRRRIRRYAFGATSTAPVHWTERWCDVRHHVSYAPHAQFWGSSLHTSLSSRESSNFFFTNHFDTVDLSNGIFFSYQPRMTAIWQSSHMIIHTFSIISNLILEIGNFFAYRTCCNRYRTLSDGYWREIFME